MPITIGNNIASLVAQRRLADGTSALERVFERLSSGQRINRASDDAAGLAIADSLRADSRVFTQGVRNLNDGISLLNIADSAIESLSSIVVRLEELAEQAANGVYGTVQRKAIDAEAQELSREFLRIAQSSEFNGIRLFTGENPEIALQAGVGENAILFTSVGGAIGTGDYGAGTTYNTEEFSTQDLSLGDLNGDGYLDLVTAGRRDGEGGAIVRLGNGTGGFVSSQTYSQESGRTYGVELGDLNGDGILDLVTAGFDSSNTDSHFTVRLGDGQGSFGAATSYLSDDRDTFGLQLGDLNSDGVLDVVTSGTDDGGNGTSTVRLGNGDGTFGTSTSYQMSQGFTREIEIADLDGDGALDLIGVGTNFSSDGEAVVRMGNGDGTFQSETVYAAEGDTSTAVEVGDLNGDGILDLITAGYDDTPNGYATVRLGNGDGSFGTAVSYTTEARDSQALHVVDVNGDGFLDLFSAGRDATTDGYATLRLGSGDGTFGTAKSFATEIGTSLAIRLGDLDGDGVLDLVTGGQDDSNDGKATVRLGLSVDGVAPLLEFSLASVADARQALPMFSQKREQLSEQRGEIGAHQSRIDVAKSVLTVASENFKAAESRIRDADIAIESSKLVRLGILQQAASSVLAQANLQPQLALRLLNG